MGEPAEQLVTNPLGSINWEIMKLLKNTSFVSWDKRFTRNQTLWDLGKKWKSLTCWVCQQSWYLHFQGRWCNWGSFQQQYYWHSHATSQSQSGGEILQNKGGKWAENCRKIKKCNLSSVRNLICQFVLLKTPIIIVPNKFLCSEKCYPWSHTDTRTDCYDSEIVLDRSIWQKLIWAHWT